VNAKAFGGLAASEDCVGRIGSIGRWQATPLWRRVVPAGLGPARRPDSFHRILSMLGALARKSKPSFLLLRDGVGFGVIKYRRESRRQRRAAP